VPGPLPAADGSVKAIGSPCAAPRPPG